MLITRVLTICFLVWTTITRAEVIELEYNSDDNLLSYTEDTEDDYELRETHGFKVYIDKEVLAEHEEKIEAVYSLVEDQLNYMKHRFPVKVMEKLAAENVKIIINDDCEGEDWDDCPGFAYRPYAWWLPEFNSKAIMIRQIDILLKINAGQPAGIAHEMAHAYHELFLPDGFDNQMIIDAYQKAVDSGKYEQVNHIFTSYTGDRERVRARAMINEREFFAEMSEALWLRNDYEPFTFFDVFDDETLTERRDDGSRFNPVWSAWWWYSGPHGDEPWYWQTLGTEDEDSDNNAVPEIPFWLDFDHVHE